jgi:hypothetical protein
LSPSSIKTRAHAALAPAPRNAFGCAHAALAPTPADAFRPKPALRPPGADIAIITFLRLKVNEKSLVARRGCLRLSRLRHAC